MNSNQSKNLTQKQQELVKRLESIRNNRESTSQEVKQNKKSKSSANSQRRNEDSRQNRPVPTRSKKQVDNKRTRPVNQSKFARPAEDAPVIVEPRVEYKPRVVQPRKKVQRPRVAITKKKNEDHYIKQLTNGKNLAQAIVLSEILDKPISLRRR